MSHQGLGSHAELVWAIGEGGSGFSTPTSSEAVGKLSDLKNNEQAKEQNPTVGSINVGLRG